MKCPYCGHPDTRVIDSRPAEDNNAIRRRRSCDECGKRFTTYEKVETIPPDRDQKKTITESSMTDLRLKPEFCGHAISVLFQHSRSSRRSMISSSRYLKERTKRSQVN